MIYDSKIVAKHTCTVIMITENELFPLEKVFSSGQESILDEPLGIKYDPDKRGSNA